MASAGAEFPKVQTPFLDASFPERVCWGIGVLEGAHDTDFGIRFITENPTSPTIQKAIDLFRENGSALFPSQVSKDIPKMLAVLSLSPFHYRSEASFSSITLLAKTILQATLRMHGHEAIADQLEDSSKMHAAIRYHHAALEEAVQKMHTSISPATQTAESRLIQLPDQFKNEVKWLISLLNGGRNADEVIAENPNNPTIDAARLYRLENPFHVSLLPSLNEANELLEELVSSCVENTPFSYRLFCVYFQELPIPKVGNTIPLNASRIHLDILKAYLVKNGQDEIAIKITEFFDAIACSDTTREIEFLEWLDTTKFTCIQGALLEMKAAFTERQAFQEEEDLEFEAALDEAMALTNRLTS